MVLEFVEGQAKQWIPVVDGMLLHSIQDPAGEAFCFIENEWARLVHAKSVIVYGLGGAFHIEELLRRADFQILVIEAHKELVAEVSSRKPEVCREIEILAGVPPAQIIYEAAVQRAMAQPFTVLKHPVSLHSSPFYYQAVHGTLTSRTLKTLKILSEKNKSLFHFFESLDLPLDQTVTLPLIAEAVTRRDGHEMGYQDLLWMAMRELVP